MHPDEVLREEFLRPMNLSPYAVARAVGVPRTRIRRLANERTAVTADTALRLARYFGTSPAFWMGKQAQYDLERAEDELGAELRKITSAGSFLLRTTAWRRSATSPAARAPSGPATWPNRARHRAGTGRSRVPH